MSKNSADSSFWQKSSSGRMSLLGYLSLAFGIIGTGCCCCIWLDGAPLRSVTHDWHQAFEVPAGAAGELVVRYDPPLPIPWRGFTPGRTDPNICPGKQGRRDRGEVV